MKSILLIPVLVSILILGTLGLSQDAFASHTAPYTGTTGHCDRTANPPVPLVDYSNCNLNNVDLTRANLSGADLSGANLVNLLAFDIDFSGANLSGTWLFNAIIVRGNFVGANFGCPSNCADLVDADIVVSNFSGANLSGVDLNFSNLSSSNFSGANLSGARITNSNFSGADLTDADLTRADLGTGTIFTPTTNRDCVGNPICNQIVITCATGTTLNTSTNECEADVTQSDLDLLQNIISQFTTNFSVLLVQPIIDAVNGLSPPIDSSDVTPLTRTLERSLSVAERADGVACKGALGLIDDANTLEADGILTTAEADTLRDQANALLDTCPP